MKKIIFLCLLSLSVCLSKPAVEEASQPTAVSNSAVDPKTQKPDQTLPAHITESQTPPKTTAPTEQKIPQNVSEPLSTIPSLPPKNTENAKPTNDNKTTDKQSTTKETTQSTTVNNATTEKVNNDVKPTENAKEEPSTEKVSTMKPTEVPKTTEAPKSDADKHILQARGFDGASFIGGIILTLGLLAIGFMGFKYYKNQTERNYHTL
ncbi:salivary glue protein Sgs-3 isoform X2 [Vanessa atalanta]|uniref:salivary glue protein Sgs-3 isoform X2 n=1 Tax=Vanessa atalanta TaxID=42275 RepID=UPI001FCD5CB3|nr:salivary glue protein Sgs-3 isoform X2 [Vanessa atalanta]